MNRMKVGDQWVTLQREDIDTFPEPAIPEQPSDCGNPDLCKGCRYPSVGFLCRGVDGRCLRSEMKRLYERRKRQHETE